MWGLAGESARRMARALQAKQLLGVEPWPV